MLNISCFDKNPSLKKKFEALIKPGATEAEINAAAINVLVAEYKSIHNETNSLRKKAGVPLLEFKVPQELYDYVAAISQPTPKAAPITPTAPVSTGTYILDGKTQNTFTTPSGKKIIFTAPADITKETAAAKIRYVNNDDLKEIVANLKAGGKDPGVEVSKVIFNAIAPTLNEMKALEAELTVTIPDDVEEVVVADAEAKLGAPVSQSVLDVVNRRISGLDNEVLREVIKKELKTFVPENWDQVEKWLKANFPNIPVYRVKNIIQATNGRQAWGMFKDGAIYIYENAEVGTVYHEVFHAVWRMFADPAEQKAVMDEMKARSGTFFDRSSLKDVKYSEATEEQLEEKLAEEF